MSFPAKPIVQISLDLSNIDEALETAAMALRAGVDWLEAGTPLILAEGAEAVKALRQAFPYTSIVANLKSMDGGYPEVEMMAKAGATHLVVMARARKKAIKGVVRASEDFNLEVMGEDLGCPDKRSAAIMLEDLGCDYVVHHIELGDQAATTATGKEPRCPMDQLSDVVDAVSVPVQAVGDLTIEQAIACPTYGAPMVVLGTPLTLDADAFKAADGDLESALRLVCDAIHAHEVE